VLVAQKAALNKKRNLARMGKIFITVGERSVAYGRKDMPSPTGFFWIATPFVPHGSQ